VIAIAAGAVIIAVVVRSNDQEDFQRLQRQEAARSAHQAEEVAQLSIGQLANAAALYRVEPDLDQHAFQVLGRTLIRESALHAAAFVSAARDCCRITQLASESNGPASRGFDLSSDPRHGAAIERARESGQAAVTAVAPILIGQGKGLVVYLPVYRDGAPLKTTAERRAALVGLAAGAFRGTDLAAAATAALQIREVGIRHGGVTTVGAMRSEPGVITAIAGVTEMMLDLRHLDADTLATMLAECLEACEKAAAQFDCAVAPVRIFGATPTPFHPQLVQLAIDSVAEAGGGEGPPIPSGPLHDATEVGRLVPTVMLFAQSDPPLSHTKIEDSPQDALRVAIEAYGRTVGRTLDLVAAGGLEEDG
jgi:N-carbamoyl-L-amino-acid hydrolase